MAALVYSPNQPSRTRVYTKNLLFFHPAGRSYRGHETAAAAAGRENTILGRVSISSVWRKRAGWITTVSPFSMY